MFSSFKFSNKIDVGSLEGVKPGGALMMKENKIHCRLPFTTDPAKQLHVLCFLSTLAMIVCFLLKYDLAESFSL